jgi:hypothetical protein
MGSVAGGVRRCGRGSAVNEDGKVLLRGAGQGHYELLVQGQGRHTIRLNLVAGVQTAAEGRSFTLQCPVVGVSNLELEIPEPELAVLVTPRRTFELQADREDTTEVRAVLGATDRFTVSWHPASGVADLAAGLANVSSTIAVDVGDGVVHTHAVFDYQILRGSLDELLIDVPADQRLLDVQAAGLRDWQTETVEDWQQVRVRLHAPVTGSVRLELHTESPLPDEAFQVGHVRAVGVARESGILAVRSAEDVGLEFVVRQSLARVDAADVPEPLRKPRTTYYKFFTSDHQLTLVASARQPRIIVDSHFAVLVDKARTTTQGEFRYQISRSGIFALSFRLPPGIRVDDVRSESLERFDITPGEDSQTLNVYFARQVLGELAVSVSASQTRGESAGSLELPLPEPLDVWREEGLVAVIAPESLEVATDAEQLVAARTATPAELAARGFQPRIPAGSTLASAFAFVRRPVHIVQTITERPRRMLATVSTAATLSEDVVQVTTEIQLPGPLRRHGHVPPGRSRRRCPTGCRSKAKASASAAEAEQPERRWLDGMDDRAAFRDNRRRRLHGHVRSAAFAAERPGPVRTATDPRAGGGPRDGRDRHSQGSGAVRRGNADRSGRDRSARVVPATGHRAALPGIPVLPAPGRTDAAHDQARNPGRGPDRGPPCVRRSGRDQGRAGDDAGAVRRDVQRAAASGVDTPQSAHPEHGGGRSDGAAGDRSRRSGQRVGGQDLLHQRGASRANGRAVRDRRRSSRPPGPQTGWTSATRLRLALPQFDHGVKFQKTYVRVWVPREYRLVGDPDGFTSHIGVGLWDSRAITPASDDPDTWFRPDASPFDADGTPYLFSSLEGPAELQTAYWHIPTMTFIASAIALALGVVLLRFSLETKVFTVLAVALMVVFFGLFWPSVINSWLLAARMGIAAVISLWLVAWFLYVHRSGVIQQVLAAPEAGEGKGGSHEPQ